ncbi:MAG: Nicotinate phosphoribosyltransferase C-terminal domain, partial [Pseudonocardiales bacterium]|nr:Nicotinate phosphoribosyltransferase C-terminal domain [Pseudonocardiales bacterium]
PHRDDERPLLHAVVRDGHVLDVPSLVEAREHCRRALDELPPEAAKLSPGDPAIETVHERARP